MEKAVLRVSLLFFSFATMGSAGAARLDYSLELGALYDDNVRLTENDRSDDIELIPRLIFLFTEDATRLTANVAGDIEYRDYTQGTFSNDFRGTLAGTAVWHVIPQRMDWVFEDYLGRQPINVLLDNTPDNQQQTNFFLTGPTFHAHFSDRSSGQLDLRYSNSYADTTREFNGNRLSALGQWLYRLSETRSVAVYVQDQGVRYNSAPSTLDYDRQDLYGGYRAIGAHSQLDLEAGYTWLSFRNGGGSDSGVRLLGRLRYDLGPRTRLGAEVERSFSDTAQDLIMDPDRVGKVVIGSGLDNMLVSPQVYTQTRASVDFSYATDRHRFSVAPFWRKLDYVTDTTLDEKSVGGYAEYAFQWTPLTSLQAFAGANRREYAHLDRTDTDRSVGARLFWQMARQWLWRFEVQHTTRSTNAPGLDYTDNQFLVAIRYSR